MHYNGDSIEFLQKLSALGKTTALDDMPVLEEDAQDLWQMYCFIGEDVLLGMDIYARRIGIPEDWEFEQCLLLIASLQKTKRELLKADKHND